MNLPVEAHLLHLLRLATVSRSRVALKLAQWLAPIPAPGELPLLATVSRSRVALKLARRLDLIPAPGELLLLATVSQSRVALQPGKAALG